MPYWTSFRSTALHGMQPGCAKSSVTGWSGFMASFGFKKPPCSRMLNAGAWVSVRKARHHSRGDGPFGGVSGGECSGLSVDAVLDQWQVVGFHLDTDRVESLH